MHETHICVHGSVLTQRRAFILFHLILESDRIEAAGRVASVRPRTVGTACSSGRFGNAGENAPV